ncbi:MAG: hypothetical protein KBE09_04290 [Candidatus Pacebacteria bacterium]|nr:hypothetical protein [Candidatus Paceibacterota bacterium]
MKLSVASIRRAANDLAVYQPVSVPILAAYLRVKPQVVKRYLYKVSGLREAIDREVIGQRNSHEKYVKAVQLLERSGVRVTKVRIARCTTSTVHAVTEWLHRHPEYRPAVVSWKEHRELLIRARVEWLRRQHPSLTVIALAQHVGFTRQHMHKHLSRMR